MKKLKNKIFITIFTILSISMISILIIYNSTDYIREKSNIEDNLTKMINDKMGEGKEPPEKPDDKNLSKEVMDEEKNPKRFMDVNMYTVILSDNKIDRIISHTKDATTPNEIKKEAESIITNNKKNKMIIGNLYTKKYSYNYQYNNKIIILDNANVNKKLQINLLISFIIFGIFEVIAYLFSDKIAKWIIKPVEASFNKQKQFVADASHELKTPLSVIMASSEAMETDKNEKWLKNIQSESNRMSDLIKELLDLAKLENEDLKTPQEKNNLSKLVEMAILPLESLIYEKNISFDYNIQKNIHYQCNSNEIKQLVTILMDNAIKHCKKEGKILLELKKESTSVILTVTNEGEPIPKGEEEKIFERFYRIDKSRNRNDNRYGLGLAIAKRITENNHGMISARSDEDNTTFEVIFKKLK